jgi:hypothetical protein
MISGTADDRMAFVIETESKLDAIKQARSEVRGIGTDSQVAAKQMAALSESNALASVSTVAGTRNMGAWAAMQAEAAGHVGEHTLAIGRLEMSLARFAERATGVNSTVGILGASMARFAIGGIETAGILIGIDAIIAGFDLLTAGMRKTMDESDKVIKALLKMAELDALGFGGKFLQDIGKMGEALPVETEWAAVLTNLGTILSQVNPALSELFKWQSESHIVALGDMPKAMEEAFRRMIDAQRKGNDALEKSRAADLATLVAYNGRDEAARQSALTQIRKYQEDLAALGETEYAKRAELVRRIDQLNAPFKAEQGKEDAAFSKDISRLRSEGTRLTAMVDKSLDDADKAAAKLAAGEVKGEAMYAQMQAHSLEMTFKTIDQETNAKLAANDAEYMRRQVDIAKLDDTEGQKTKLLAAAERDRAATAANIREAAADKVEKERQVAEAKIQAAEKRKEQIMLHSVEAFVHASASLQKILIEAALSPLIKELEGTAIRQFVRAAASFAAGDFAGAAQHAAAGALATAGAREVAQLGAMAGGGSSSSAGGGGGGSTGTGSSVFSPTSGTEGQGNVTINLLTQNPYGYEQIQQVQYNLNRAGILKVPIPISPTKQLMAGG